MRIVQFVNYFFPSVGGTQLATYHLTKNLVKLEPDVKIFTFNVDPRGRLRNGCVSSGLPSYQEIGGVPVYRFPVFYLGNPTFLRVRISLGKY